LPLRNAMYNEKRLVAGIFYTHTYFKEQTYDKITISNKKHLGIISLYFFVGLFCLDG